MNCSFWRGKRVFITGHTGFKGSWLSLWLQQLGAQVTGYALQPPTRPNLFEVASVGVGMTTIIGDIRDGGMLTKCMRHAEPDIVFHLAAQPLVRRSYKDPVETYSTNVMGTVFLLEAIRQTNSVRVVVNVTSDKCYENKEWVWGYRESDQVGGYDPYSNSKGCAELITSAYRNSFFNKAHYSEHKVSIATARAGNVIGGGDWAEDRLIPDIFRALESGLSVKIRNPHSTRPWQHVLEPLSGYLKLAENMFTKGVVIDEAFNFGPTEDDVKPVQWIIEEIVHQWGSSATWSLDSEIQPHESRYLKLDCSKARSVLGWLPRWNINQALNATIEWNKLYRSNNNMQKICLKQIENYNFNN